MGNILQGDWGTMCIGGAGVVTFCTIVGNYILNVATDNDVCISMAATATGMIAWNATAGGAAAQGNIPGDCGCIENYYDTSTGDAHGVIDPAAG